MSRTISVSESSLLFDCEAKHAFAYTGALTGGTALQPKLAAVTLRRGRAWGAAVAAWHQTGDHELAATILLDALDVDALEQEDLGVYLADEHQALAVELLGLLDHYVATAERLPLHSLERELRVPLPSRTGQRASNRYVFHGHVDGLTDSYEVPGLWIVEFKLRGRLSSFEQVAWSRQIRWYAWAAERVLDRQIAGVIVDERLAEVPKPARLVKAKRKGEGIDGMVPSHAKDQATTALSYVAACAQYGVEPDDETAEALRARRWQARHPVLLRRDEIERAGMELVSAGRRVAEMDAGERFPVANPSQFRCPGCAYREVCKTPSDSELIDTNFTRIPAKKDRPREEHVLSVPVLPSQARVAVR